MVAAETSTLIHGPNNAVLCDPPVTIQQCTVLADWIDSILALYATSSRPRKSLQFIYITHAHGDHFFGAPVLQARFPEEYEKLWKVLFPKGQLSEQQVCATALPTSNEFVLDGHTLKTYDVSADHKESSILHVPSLDLVVCGDVVYGDCHQYFVEANTTERRRLWLDALDVVDSLNSKICLLLINAQAKLMVYISRPRPGSTLSILRLLQRPARLAAGKLYTKGSKKPIPSVGTTSY